jgi:hypothetical protein
MSLGILSTCGSAEVADRMLRSAAHHGLKVRLEVCRMGSPHGADIQAVWPINEWLPSMTEEYVMMVDAPDVLFLADEDEIMKKFRSFGNDLVMSAEYYCMPRLEGIALDTILSNMVPPLHHPYPNCGCWIGRRERAIELLRFSMEHYRGKPPDGKCGLDGPGAWFSYGLMEGTMDFALDHASVLFQSMGSFQTNECPVIQDGRIYNTLTGTWPIAIHYNGGAALGRESYNRMAHALYGYPL